jgi:hypothetical protein
MAEALRTTSSFLQPARHVALAYVPTSLPARPRSDFLSPAETHEASSRGSFDGLPWQRSDPSPDPASVSPDSG